MEVAENTRLHGRSVIIGRFASTWADWTNSRESPISLVEEDVKSAIPIIMNSDEKIECVSRPGISA